MFLLCYKIQLYCAAKASPPVNQLIFHQYVCNSSISSAFSKISVQTICNTQNMSARSQTMLEPSTNSHASHTEPASYLLGDRAM